MRPEKLKVVQIFDFKYTYYTSFTVCISLIALQLFLAVSTAIFTSSICLCKSTPAPQLLSIFEEYISATGLALRRGTSKSFAHGNGAIASVMKTNSAVAQSYPSFSYTMQKHQHLHFIASPFFFILLTLSAESGNAAPKALLAKLLAASALAAYSGYALTRNVHGPENDRKTLHNISE
jgi:hypothetical protein